MGDLALEVFFGSPGMLVLVNRIKASWAQWFAVAFAFASKCYRYF